MVNTLLTTQEYNALLSAINSRELELEDDVERGDKDASKEARALDRASRKVALALAPRVPKPR